MLIVIEGVDGSGKETHTKLLYERLIQNNKNVKKITFPNYESESSALVKMYLAGAFGNNAQDVNVYAASSFYAVDRFASYQTTWKKYLDNGDIVLADRYVTSNMIHQACKLNGEKRDQYLDWLCDYEYNLLGLPKPDLVVFLNMPPEVGQKLTKDRKNKFNGSINKDIHEKDNAHLNASYEAALYSAERYGWKVINLSQDGVACSIDENASKIYEAVSNYLKLGDN